MANKLIGGIEARVLSLRKSGFTYSQIKTILKAYGCDRGFSYISNVINCKDKVRHALAENKIPYNDRRSARGGVTSPRFLLEVSKLMLKPKPVHPSQMRRCSTAIIKCIIINDLKKGIGRLSEGEKANRKTTSRKLYGKISGKKSEFAVSISQGVIYFNLTTNKVRLSGGTSVSE